MGKLLYLGLFLASLDKDYETGSDHARRGLLQTDMMKTELSTLQNQVEKTVYTHTGLTKDDLVYFAYAYPLVAGKLSTKPFRGLQMETQFKWVLRPDAEYNITTKEYIGNFVITKEF